MPIDREELEKKFKQEVESYNKEFNQTKNIIGISMDCMAEMYIKVGRIKMMAEILGIKIENNQFVGEVTA